MFGMISCASHALQALTLFDGEHFKQLLMPFREHFRNDFSLLIWIPWKFDFILIQIETVIIKKLCTGYI